MGHCGWNGSGWVKLAVRHSILIPSTGRILALLLAACHFHFYTTLLLAWLIPSNPYLTLQSTHSFFPSSLLRKPISIRCCYIAVISALQQISLWPSVLWLQVLLRLSSLSIDFKTASPSRSILPRKAHKPN